MDSFLLKLNRLVALGVSSATTTATTTYAYDAFGSRVLQVTPTATTSYPNQYYSVTSTQTGSTTTATSTEYI